MSSKCSVFLGMKEIPDIKATSPIAVKTNTSVLTNFPEKNKWTDSKVQNAKYGLHVSIRKCNYLLPETVRVKNL